MGKMTKRPLMTAAELREHQVASYGRDYSESDDGYSDAAAETRRGWHAISGWGADGWDLGEWPYVMIYTRETSPGELRSLSDAKAFELMQICEGDRTRYSFDSEADRIAAIDYLFLWYAAGQRWAPVGYEDREALDAGTIKVGDRFRGEYAGAIKGADDHYHGAPRDEV